MNANAYQEDTLTNREQSAVIILEEITKSACSLKGKVV